MSTPKTQYFAGYKFTRGDEGTYYRCAKLKKRMHIFVWEYYNGQVPAGYEVHHKDLDKSNNDISNLELLTVSQHRKLHANLLTDEQREWRRQNLAKNARPKACEWHKSDVGRAWHRGMITLTKEKRQTKQQLICSTCGKSYVGMKYSKSIDRCYCSNKCRHDAFNQRHKDDIYTQICLFCNQEFTSHRKRQTCSNVCAERLRQKRHNENKKSDQNRETTTCV